MRSAGSRLQSVVSFPQQGAPSRGQTGQPVQPGQPAQPAQPVQHGQHGQPGQHGHGAPSEQPAQPYSYGTQAAQPYSYVTPAAQPYSYGTPAAQPYSYGTPAAQPQAYEQAYGEAQGGAHGQMVAGQMDGHMASGHMAAAPPDTGNLPSRARNFSSTLLGEGEGDEPPILEELGINFEHIRAKTKMVLNPFSRAKLVAGSPIADDDDFAGPLLFCMCLGVLLLFKGKIHFGTIYGVFVVGWLGIWAILNLMSPRGIDIYRTASIMGYSLLPIVLLAALSIPFEMRGAVGLVFMPLTVIWCSSAASMFFVATLEAEDRRWLLAYPVALFYTCFALITVF